MKILIGFAGNHDPIGGCYDGPILHIIRKISIDKTYIFLTKSFDTVEKKDELTKAIVKLNDNKKLKNEVIFISTNIENPAEFKDFNLSYFIKDILEKNTHAEVYYNLTSGTQQIISALALDIIINNRKGQALQVFNPNPKNPSVGIISNIDENFDDIEETNRLYYTNLDSFKYNSIKTKLKNYILLREYQRAYIYLSELNVNFTNKTKLINLLKFSSDFDGLNELDELLLSEINKTYESLGKIYMLKEINHNVFKLFNYYLSWENYYYKKEYKEYLLYLTPLFYELLKHELIRCISKNGQVPKELKESLENDKFNKEFLEKNPDFMDRYKLKINDHLDSKHLIFMLREHNSNKLNEIEKIRNLEIEFRNKIAHNISNKITINEFERNSKVVKEKINLLIKDIFKDYMKYIDLYLFKNIDNHINYEINKIGE